MGFQAIRVKVLVEGDAPREVLDEIVRHANFYSPAAQHPAQPDPDDGRPGLSAAACLPACPFNLLDRA